MKCPGCGEERHPAQFADGERLCSVCRECGAPHGAKGTEDGAMPTGTMEKRPCAKGCGKMLDPRGAPKHEHHCAGKAVGEQAGKPSAAKPASRGRRSSIGKILRTQEPSCEACPFRGLTRAIDQELVAEAIRGGMNLPAATAFVRRALAAAR